MSIFAVGGAAASLAFSVLTRARRRMHFEGKAVLITGGSRGLGLAIARQLVDEGARVALVARDRQELVRAGDFLGDSRLVLIERDLSQPEQMVAVVHEAARALGGLDVLVNNAGMIDVGPVEHMSAEDFQRSMAVHFWAPLLTTFAALPYLQRRGGRIVNIASVGGMVAVPHLAPYCAGKFALVGASDALRAELRRHGIYVTTVCPGLMRTGSHVNARFKGEHQAEYAWFSTGAALGSVSVARAARAVVRAARYGMPHLTIGLSARLLILGNVLLPNLMGEAMAVVAKWLPDPAGVTAEAFTGWESRGREPSVVRRADKAILPNNQLAGHAPPEAMNGHGNGHGKLARGAS